jgi:hypothetical protein
VIKVVIRKSDMFCMYDMHNVFATLESFSLPLGGLDNVLQYEWVKVN